jgi:tight adherence protein B
MMIIAALVLAGISGLLILRPAPGRSLRRRTQPASEDPPPDPESDRRPRRVVAAGALVVTVPTAGFVVWGLPGLCLSLPVVISGGTIGYLIGRAARRRHAWQNRRQVAQACSVLAAQVRIGQVPLVALRSAAEDCPVLRAAAADADLGGDVVPRWRSQAGESGMDGLSDLARAWQWAVRTGAGMADVLDDVADGLAADEALRWTIGSEAAGPRASGKIMAALPLVGIGLGYAIGGDPLHFLVATPYGWGCLIGGSVLASAGVLWMERVADSAAAER